MYVTMSLMRNEDLHLHRRDAHWTPTTKQRPLLRSSLNNTVAHGIAMHKNRVPAVQFLLRSCVSIERLGVDEHGGVEGGRIRVTSAWAEPPDAA